MNPAQGSSSRASLRPAAGNRYFRGYLKIAPLSLALWRAAEARAFASCPLPRPLLDIGCGFGEFGSVFFDEPADVGLDVSRSDLRVVPLPGPYEHLAQADGRRLPFSDETFASVVSVSVLEHIDEAERVIPEAWRVLRPGGSFVFTTPAPSMREMLFYSRLLSAVGLRTLGERYGEQVDKIFHHVSVKPLEEWSAILESAGFRIQQARYTIPSKLTLAFDLTLPGALPSQIGRLAGRGRWVWRPPGVVTLLERLLGRLVEEEAAEGCNLFFAAEKS